MLSSRRVLWTLLGVCALTFAALSAPAATPRILYVGDSWTYYPWAEQSPPALGSVLSRPDIVSAIGGEYSEVGDIALHGATAAQWDTPELKAEITQKLGEYPSIDVVHISLGGNDVNLGWKITHSPEQTAALLSETVNHIRNVVLHCLSVRPNVRVAICGYDYLNIAEGYTWGVWTNPYTFETIVYVKTVENPTLVALLLYGIDIKIFNPDYPFLGWTTVQQVAANQATVDSVFIDLERRKKDMAVSIDRATYIHAFGIMQAFFGIPSASIPPNASILPQGRSQGYANFPAGYPTLWSPRQAMAGSSELDPIHLNPQGYIHLMENAVSQVYLPWLGDSIPPTVSSIARASANPPDGPSVAFTVTFSESVTGVDADDFALDVEGAVTGAGILGVTGGGSAYTVTVSTPTGEGSFSIDLIDNNSIYDAVWAPLDGPGQNDFVQGERYTLSNGIEGEGLAEGSAEGEGVSEGSAEGEGQFEGIAEGEGLAEGLAEGEGLTEGNADGEGHLEGTTEGEGIAEGIAEGEGLSEGSADGEGLAEGLAEGEGFIEGNVEGEGIAEGEGVTEGSAEGEGQIEGVSEGEGLAEGMPEGEGLIEGVSEGLPEGEGPIEGAAEGEGEGSLPLPWHSADSDRNWRISLTELLRVIQFFNMRRYHVESGTEDGYGPGPGSQEGAPHASDYAPQNWNISLVELLRVIQFFNIGGYSLGDGTEDGFLPGSGGPRPGA
jgi:lysophospholipase L1-like esterase